MKGVTKMENGFCGLDIEPEILQAINSRKFVESGVKTYKAPAPGKSIRIPLCVLEDRGTKYMFGMYRGAVRSHLMLGAVMSRKETLVTLRSTLALVRVDLGPYVPHTNPDGELIKGPHMHIAISGNGDQYAIPLSRCGVFGNPAEYDDVSEIFENFRMLCNISDDLVIEWPLDIGD